MDKLAIVIEYGEVAKVFATQTARVHDTTNNKIYVLEEDSFGDKVATRLEVGAWSELPAKYKKAIREEES